MLTSFASGLWSFRIFRFLVGCGGAANWPGAAKAVGEWFPDRERGWVVSLLNSGYAPGAVIALFPVVWLHQQFGTWRPGFLMTGMLGCLWLFLWWRWYYSPSVHPRLTPDELARIQQGQSQPAVVGRPTWADWVTVLRKPQTWGIVLCRMLLDPYRSLVADWLALYIASRGFRLEDTVVAFSVPFLAADIGNFFGGGASSWLVRRGWPVLQARRATFFLCAPGMLALLAVPWLNSLAALVACFGVAMFGCAACVAIYLVLPTDLYPNQAVASVSGLSGTGSGLSTIASTYAIGRGLDLTHSFTLVFIGASAAPVIGFLLTAFVVRRTSIVSS
jgi:ACS family hexuronate transporter-like MFS transporter